MTMLTDAQWAELAPLVEQCRPHAKVPPSNLRRTISAILWRHTNGGRQVACRAGGTRALVDGGPDLHPLVTPGRVAVAAEAGPGTWCPARHDLPGRHQHPGTSESCRCCSPKDAAAQRGPGEAPVGSADIPPGDRAQPDGRSRGGYGTKACVIADAAGRAIAFRLAPGPAHELPQALPLLEALPGVPPLGCRWQPPLRGWIGRRPMGGGGSRPRQPWLP
jgi:hypothetical protein